MKITFDNMCIAGCKISKNEIKKSNVEVIKNLISMSNLSKEEKEKLIEFLKENDKPI